MSSTNQRPSSDIAIILSEINKDGKYDAIIERAKNRGYHDFKFDTIADHPEYGDCNCPKMQLVEDLYAFPELLWLRKEVEEGIFDDGPDSDDVTMMQGWLLEDDENAPDRLFEIVGLPAPRLSQRLAVNSHKYIN